jgi:hypothetical protein
MSRLWAGLAMASLAGMAMTHQPIEPTTPPPPDPEAARKRAVRLGQKLAKQRVSMRYDGMPSGMDNRAAKLMGLPHQGSREMARRARKLNLKDQDA